MDPAADPRRTLPATGTESDVRPAVARAGGGVPTPLIAGGVVVAGLALFLVLDAQRRAAEMPAVRATAAERAVAAGPPAPPPLYLPPADLAPVPARIVETVPAPAPFVLPPPPTAPRIVYVPQTSSPPMPQPMPMPMPQPSLTLPQQGRGGDGNTLVIDTTTADGPPVAASDQAREGDGGQVARTFGTIPGTTAPAGARARATMLAGRATTVLQGTLIAAVLETALDTTRPGLARAIVSQDIRGFDGSRVLIPRGSRLTGEYRSDVQPGQNRALIVWTRLVRPDGAAVAIASPVADTQGRGGVKAKVDSHFLARFAGAILQSVLSIGVNLASRSSNNDTVVLGLPGSSIGGGGFGFNQNGQVTPTLKVRPGTSIGVFVSRDLDFTGVEGRR